MISSLTKLMVTSDNNDIATLTDSNERIDKKL